MKRLVGIFLVLVLTTFTACGSARDSASTDTSPRARGNGTVILGQQLRSSGGNLLSALAAGVSSLRVQRGSGCPQITFRGGRSLMNGGSPNVYVDRSRFRDTCVLAEIQSRQVARVEIYPSGHTTRPGYAPHAHGLILVFLTRSADGSRP